MKIVGILLVSLILFLVGLTSYYWKKQRELRKKRGKKSKYEMMEISDSDQRYHDYYEPQIIEVVSSIEYL